MIKFLIESKKKSVVKFDQIWIVPISFHNDFHLSKHLFFFFALYVLKSPLWDVFSV